jgi:hypothetical protein
MWPCEDGHQSKVQSNSRVNCKHFGTTCTNWCRSMKHKHHNYTVWCRFSSTEFITTKYTKYNCCSITITPRKYSGFMYKTLETTIRLHLFVARMEMKSTDTMIAITQTTTIQKNFLSPSSAKARCKYTLHSLFAASMALLSSLFFLLNHSIFPSIVLNHSLISLYS